MGLEIIGAGVGRTGTTSLKTALETLGFGPCHHMTEVVFNPAALQRWIAIADGDHDWEAAFAGYRSAVDWPEVAFWRELAAYYPHAKVILTERDPEAWFRSTQETILSPERDQATPGPMQTLMGKLMARFEPAIHDKARMIAAFLAHNAEVRRAIPPERLLVYEVAQGWGPLCAFLGVPEPDAPMPHANSTDDFKTMIRNRLAARSPG
jgi:hypothetical protein